ncbi:hypothetical protein Tco_0731339 [Tanacetum coccineum]
MSYTKVVYDGWMVRYGTRTIGWLFLHMRYFVPESRLLAYYKRKPQDNVVPIKTLVIDGNCRVDDRVVNLTLIDLPGLTIVVVGENLLVVDGGERKDIHKSIVEDIENMVCSYVKKDKNMFQDDILSKKRHEVSSESRPGLDRGFQSKKLYNGSIIKKFLAIANECLFVSHNAALKRVLRYDHGTLDFRFQLYASTTAEYIGVSNLAETVWLHSLLRKHHTPLLYATLVYYDNVSVIYLTANHVQQRIKHIKIDIYFVCDMIARGEVRVLHVPSRYLFAHIFTKGLLHAYFEEFRTSLSEISSSAQTASEC